MPATAERVIGMAPLAGMRLSAIRDRALLLIGFAGAFRRSELVALNADDIEETAEGLRVTIRRSKTDQEGHGHVIAIPHGVIACPVTALKAWLEAAGIAQGPVFRPVAKGGRIRATRLTDRSVADIVKAHAQRAGLDPKLFAGHSLRSGFLTSAAALEDGHAARLRPGRRDFQAPCRGRLVCKKPISSFSSGGPSV
jgi:integrase